MALVPHAENASNRVTGTTTRHLLKDQFGSFSLIAMAEAHRCALDADSGEELLAILIRRSWSR